MELWSPDISANRRIVLGMEGPPRCGVPCPDWKFFNALAVRGETWVTDQTLSNSDYCLNTDFFYTYFNVKKK